jgi:anti-sigma-K factor RskA
MNLTWQKVAAIVTVVTVVGGSAFAIERYFAKQTSHEKLATVVAKADEKYVSIEDFLAMNKRMTLNTLEDTLYKTQTRLWQFEDRYAKTQDPTLLRDIEEMEDKIKILKQKIYNLETGTGT